MQRTELLQAIKATMIGIGKDESPTGLDFLIFDNNWIRSFNDELSVSCQIKTDVKGAVKAHELIKVLDKMGGETIRISEEKGSLIIKDSHTTLKMHQMEAEALDQLQGQINTLDTDNLKWKPIPSGFMDGLTICLFSAGTAPELGILAGVAFEGEQIVATDNFRITQYMIKGTISKEFVLPSSVANGLKQLGKDFKKISITDAWVHFKDEQDLIVSVRRLLGDYPFEDIMKLLDTNFPKNTKLKIYTLPEGLEKSIERAEVLAGSGDDDDMNFITLISLKRSGKNLIIRAEKEAGSLEDKMLWPEGDGFPEELELRVSPEFLKRIIKVSRTFQLGPNNTTILFKGENFKHLMVAKVG